MASVGTPATLALEPGVHADPGSPAAKEYALPLSEARHTGGARSAPGRGALFGAGIHPTGAHGSEGVQARRATAAAHGRHTTPTGSQAGSPAVAGRAPGVPSAVTSASRTGSGGGDGSMLTLLGGGVAVLALGGIGGTVLRGKRSAGSAGR